MSIYLIRHGETPSNRARVVQVPETPLSDRGIAQADLLAARLADVGITRIVSSDHVRAAMTAAPLRIATAVEFEFDPDLQERNFGDHRGTPYSVLTEQRIDLFGPGYVPPGGESWATFHARVDRAFSRVGMLAGGEAGHLAVVTHGLVLHSIAARLVALPSEIAQAATHGRDGPAIRFGNTAITLLSPGESAGDPWRVELFGCTRHLDGATADDGTALSGI